MATRFYLPSTGAAAVTVANDSWTKTTGAGTALAAVTAKISSAMGTITNTANGTAVTPTLIRQYVTRSFGAQTLTGTVSGVMRCIESNVNFSATLAFSVRACSSDGGTIRTGGLSIRYSDLYTTVPPEMATSLTNRQLMDSAEATSHTLSSITMSEGDRLVFEFGFTSNDTSTSRTGGISFGDNSATDCVFDQTGTAANNPWIEFSANLVEASTPSIFVPIRFLEGFPVT